MWFLWKSFYNESKSRISFQSISWKILKIKNCWCWWQYPKLHSLRIISQEKQANKSFGQGYITLMLLLHTISSQMKLLDIFLFQTLSMSFLFYRKIVDIHSPAFHDENVSQNNGFAREEHIFVVKLCCFVTKSFLRQKQ